MTELDFEYDTYEDCELANYKGFTVKAKRHHHAANPWEEWDNEPPLIADHGRDGKTTYSEEFGDPSDPIAFYSDGQINRHWKTIASQFSFDLNELLTEKIESWGENPNRPNKGSLLEARIELLREYVSELDFDGIAYLWELIGVPALSTNTRGYCQGDYGDLLIVLTPDILKAWGHKETWARRNPDRAQKILESSAELYGAWAWGDVYGFVIADDEDDHIDSCWGYYGTNHNDSGLSESAIDSIEAIIRQRKRKRAECLKTLIKNNVPLSLRSDLLRRSIA